MPPIATVELPLSIQSMVATLTRGVESVSAVMGTEQNRFTAALNDLERLAQSEQIPIAIVGGLGAIHYGYPAATQDIDVAISRVHLDQFIQVAPNYRFKVAWKSKSGWHTLMHGDVEINVIPEGGKARDSSPTLIPGPVVLGVSEGLGYANLPGWVELKLSSGRQKDRAHVVEVLKTLSDDAIQAVSRHIGQVHANYSTLFAELCRQAVDEFADERDRGRRE